MMNIKNFGQRNGSNNQKNIKINEDMLKSLKNVYRDNNQKQSAQPKEEPKIKYVVYDNREPIRKLNKQIFGGKRRINPFKKKRVVIPKQTIFIFTIMAIMFSLVFFIKPSITGLVTLVTPESTILIEDGYTKEGTQWLDIQGSRIYERCLQVQTKDSFEDIEISGKITSATNSKDLTFSLYSNNGSPKDLIDSCKVSNYESLWKSCTIKSIDIPEDTYWICASNPKGDKDRVYYTIAYQVGDVRRTALWTGENWQKLDRASYTIKAIFRK
jgi:hypothetical protein